LRLGELERDLANETQELITFTFQLCELQDRRNAVSFLSEPCIHSGIGDAVLFCRLLDGDTSFLDPVNDLLSDIGGDFVCLHTD